MIYMTNVSSSLLSDVHENIVYIISEVKIKAEVKVKIYFMLYY